MADFSEWTDNGATIFRHKLIIMFFNPSAFLLILFQVANVFPVGLFVHNNAYYENNGQNKTTTTVSAYCLIQCS